MKRRQESIIYQLAVSDRPLTTDDKVIDIKQK